MFSNTEALMYQNLKKEMKKERKDESQEGTIKKKKF